MFLALEQRSSSQVAKVSTTVRCLAKGIDLCVIFFLSIILPYPIGVLLGFIYTLIHDGVWANQSLGKRLFRLKVVDARTGAVCGIRESMIRNAPLGVATFFGIIPFWGWILLVLLGIPMVALEVYLMWTQSGGGRLGDIMADTKVVEVAKK
ncbi:MAG: RDD family protein [Bdellovibrionota bacterium]